jgi:hypothetical protein
MILSYIFVSNVNLKSLSLNASKTGTSDQENFEFKYGLLNVV